jgi:hypothetical protein
MQDTLGSRIYKLRSGVLEETQTSENPRSESDRADQSWLGRTKTTISTEARAWISLGKAEWRLFMLRRKEAKRAAATEWRPAMLRKRWLLMLLVSLIAVTTTLLVLRSIAAKQRLYSTAYGYQVELGMFNINFGPQSIVSTLIAVCIALSWDEIEKSLRGLQPYPSMSKHFSSAPHGISLSYQSTFWAWTAAKAALHSHWALCFVAIGTTFCQICKASFSLQDLLKLIS